MTTKQSSHNPMRFTFKQGLKSSAVAIAVLLCTALIVMFAGYVYNLFTTMETYAENGTVIGYENIKDSYHFLIFDNGDQMTSLLLLGTAAAGALMAICLFNFITSKKMVNVYYSLGISRTKLFSANYLVGIPLLTAACAIPMLMVFIMNLATVGFSAALLKAVLLYFFKLLLTAVTSFTITCAVFAAVGTTFEAGLFTAFLLFLPDILFWSLQSFMSNFLYGNPYGENFSLMNTYDYGYYASVLSTGLNKRFSFLSPIFWSQEQLIAFSEMQKTEPNQAVPSISPDYRYIFVWLIISAAVFALGLLLFNKRKAEISGFIGSNRVLNSAVSLLAGFTAFSFAANYMHGEDLTVTILAGVAAFSVVHLALELIVLRDLKKFTKGLYKLPVGVAVSIAILIIFNTGLFGFTERIPEASTVESIAVTAVGNTEEYGLFSNRWFETYCEISYFNPHDALVEGFSTESDKNAVIKVHEAVINTPEEERDLNTYVRFIYTLKNGKTVSRSFYGISETVYSMLLELENCDVYKKAADDYFKGDINTLIHRYDSSSESIISNSRATLKYANEAYLYGKYLNTQINAYLSNEDKSALTEALYKDIKNRTAEEKYYPESSAVGFICIPNYSLDYSDSSRIPTKTLNTYEETYIEQMPFAGNYQFFWDTGVHSENFITHITPDMTNTISFLKKIGAYDLLVQAPDFTSARVFEASEVNEFFNDPSDTSIYFTDYFYNKSLLFVSSFFADKAPDGYSESVSTEILTNLFTSAKATTDKKLISELLANAQTVYSQESLKKGYFVLFKTNENDKTVLFIPTDKMPELK